MAAETLVCHSFRRQVPRRQAAPKRMNLTQINAAGTVWRIIKSARDRVAQANGAIS